MSWTKVVATLAVFTLIIPAIAAAQATPIGARCGGSYGAEGTNFAPCVGVPSGAQTAREASAQTINIFVDTNSLAVYEDGTARAPFRTVTRGLEQARKIGRASCREGG